MTSGKAWSCHEGGSGRSGPSIDECLTTWSANAQMVGALNAAPGKPLPVDLKLFLDQQLPSRYLNGGFEEVGAVYVSVGTIVRLLEAEVLGLAANLASLNHPVLWKISDDELPGEETICACIIQCMVLVVTGADCMKSHMAALSWTPNRGGQSRACKDSSFSSCSGRLRADHSIHALRT